MDTAEALAVLRKSCPYLRVTVFFLPFYLQ